MTVADPVRPTNDLADWFPRVAGTGVPVPKTVVVPVHGGLLDAIDSAVAFGHPSVAADLAAVEAAVVEVGLPAFLRTGHLAGKHSWSRTCHVTALDAVARAVFALVETQAMAWGLPPVRTMVAREMLSTEPVFWAFESMPVTRERRYFARDGVVYDHQPYWPAGAITDPRDAPGAAWRTSKAGWPGRELVADEWVSLLRSISREEPQEVAELTALTTRASTDLPGAWSLDWLWTTDRGWVFIDAAHAEESFVMDDEQRAVLTGDAQFVPPPPRSGLLAELLTGHGDTG